MQVIFWGRLLYDSMLPATDPQDTQSIASYLYGQIDIFPFYLYSWFHLCWYIIDVHAKAHNL